MKADQPGTEIAALPPGLSDAVKTVFGDRLMLATRYVEFLATEGVTRGLVGPRELTRLWDRHVLNCAVVTELVPVGARVVDVGSGAGLPGLVMALRRSDLKVDLVESMQRRVTFLSEAVEVLGLAGSVRVVHGRAEEPGVYAVVGNSRWVTARAVAPLDRLVQWCSPLLGDGGQLIAIKGDRAETEIAHYRKAHGSSVAVRIVECGKGIVDPPVRVVVVEGQSLGSPTKTRRRK